MGTRVLLFILTLTFLLPLLLLLFSHGAMWLHGLLNHAGVDVACSSPLTFSERL